jgi:Gpi18-like mannosyltransferase
MSEGRGPELRTVPQTVGETGRSALLKGPAAAARAEVSITAGRQRVASFPPWTASWDGAVIVGLFVASRAFLLAVAAVALKVSPPPQAQGLFPDLFVRWDSLWYINLARSGYSTIEPTDQLGATNLAFYPTYPALIWLVGHLTGLSAAVAGILISNAAFLAALFVIYALGRQIGGSRLNALIAVLLISFVPQGFVFSAVYTESLFVLVTAASMLAYGRRHYVAAAVLAAIGSSIRSNGVFIAVWIGLEMVRKRGFPGALRFWEHPEEYLPAVAAPLGLLAFWWLCYFYTGDAFAQKSTVEFGWGWLPDWPWHGFVENLIYGNTIERFWVVSGLTAVALSFTLLLKGYWTLFIYCAVNFALYFSSTVPTSLLRYSIAIFPIYFGMAYYVRGPVALMLMPYLFLGGVMMVCWAQGAGVAM